MTVMQSNIEMIRQIPEERQQEIHNFLILNFADDNPFEPLTKQQIFDELAESRRNMAYKVVVLPAAQMRLDR